MPMPTLFETLRAKRDYPALGWYFWKGFATNKKTKQERLKKEWKSLTRKEKALCEEV
jgi:hypothetical protein